MNPALKWLIPLIAVLALITAGVGLFSQGGPGPFVFETLRGQQVEMFGRGLYANDSLFSGAAFRGTDVVTLLIALPLLFACYFLSLRGSQNAPIAQIGVLFYFLYIGASMAFGAAFNAMFLFYAALFSASLFAVITALATFDLQALATRIKPSFPRRSLAIFNIVAGFGTLFIWLSDLIEPLLNGSAPVLLGPYTTMFTHSFDSAVITPAAVMTAIFLLQRKPLGYLLAAPMLMLCTLIGVVVIGQTISQTLEGITFPIGIYIGMIGSWVVMGAFAIGLTISFFRNLSNEK
ncbi:hypothetical protein EYB53_023240 [Candidatus Chloroploca sp. M-50]|uniref:Uncharacterized protein n=1 Tax=Candidatus Chloroploca mongolica TaxID=2528176 RepID=A0ABS4DGU1_9CHLR|nr:hypothetical protein [Candidatus Chloroploca mongolica]MBP1468648.1 hypothetical protein [Candidatus Chloroploca mongolica]